MNNVMAILNNNPQGISLKELTGHRSLLQYLLPVDID